MRPAPGSHILRPRRGALRIELVGRLTRPPSEPPCAQLLLDGEAPLSLTDYLRPDVAIGFLASLVRYPLAFALKAPVPFFVFAAAILTLDVTASTLDGMAVASADAGEAISPSIAVAASAFALGELGLVVVTARLLLVAFLEERNAEIARSIRRAAAECDAPVVAILGGLHGAPLGSDPAHHSSASDPRITPAHRTPRISPAHRTPRIFPAHRTPRISPAHRTPRISPAHRTPRTPLVGTRVPIPMPSSVRS